MAGEIFLVSVVYWVSLLVIFGLLHRRLARLTAQVGVLEQQGKG